MPEKLRTFCEAALAEFRGDKQPSATHVGAFCLSCAVSEAVLTGVVEMDKPRLVLLGGHSES